MPFEIQKLANTTALRLWAPYDKLPEGAWALLKEAQRQDVIPNIMTFGLSDDEEWDVILWGDLYPPEVLAEAEAEITPEELPFDQRLIAWNAVRELLKETKPMDAMVTKWFREHYGIDVEMRDFEQEEPPGKFTERILSRFHDSLLVFKEQQKPA